VPVSVDWAIADMLAIRQGSIGHIRYILKDSLKYLPLYGFYFRQVCRMFCNKHTKLVCDFVARVVPDVFFPDSGGSKY